MERRETNTECLCRPIHRDVQEMQAMLLKSFRNSRTLLCLLGFKFKLLQALLHFNPLALCILTGLLLPLELCPGKANTPESLDIKMGTN